MKEIIVHEPVMNIDNTIVEEPKVNNKNEVLTMANEWKRIDQLDSKDKVLHEPVILGKILLLSLTVNSKEDNVDPSTNIDNFVLGARIKHAMDKQESLQLTEKELEMIKQAVDKNLLKVSRLYHYRAREVLDAAKHNKK